MARTRQSLVNSNAHRFRCNEPGCTTTFGRNCEQQRHAREVHGPRTFCYMRCCKWSSKRRQRLKSHLSTIHPAEATQTYHLVIPTALSPTPETETEAASPSPLPESQPIEADPEPENDNDDNIYALLEHPGSLSQQLSYPRAAHFPTSTQPRIRRDTRLRKRPASSWPSSRFLRKRSALSLPEHGLMEADPIDRDADGDADADWDVDVDSAVDVEVQGMTMIFGGFGGDLGVSFDTEMEMDVGMERADLGLGAHFEMERGWDSMR